MKILYVTTIGITMNFFQRLVKKLIDDGNVVDIATNESIAPVAPCFREWGCSVYPLSCTRSPFCLETVKTICELRKIVATQDYDIVHCHTPVAAVCTRLACQPFRKYGLKVVYTAHGFHFFKGAPLKNWLVYYPVEKLCAHLTDVLITINKEDYALAQKKMKAKRVEYVPGVGLDLSQFENAQSIADLRSEFNLPEDSKIVFSVGELNQNKNQQVIVRAIAHLADPRIHYFLAGNGPCEEMLRKLSKELGVEEQVHFLGYRRDVPALLKNADVYAFPSLREGLGMASIEAMASGLPLVTSNRHGINDYSEDGVTGFKFDPNDYRGFAEGIRKIVYDDELKNRMGDNNQSASSQFAVEPVIMSVKKIYQELLNDSECR